MDGVKAIMEACEAKEGILSHGKCYEDEGGRGGVVYNEGERICNLPLLLPGFNLFPRWILGAVYIIFLLWLFVGIGHISDYLMAGIAQITSITRKVKRKNERGEIVIIEKPVWNWAVANITLMAIGSSSPEITLSMVEALLTLGKTPGELGPACIVGGGAYNLLVMAGVSIMAVQTGTYKRIRQLSVYATTSVFAIWAFIWMLIVYRWWTPDEITVVEACLTLFQHVLLTVVAWAVDSQVWKQWGWFTRRNATAPSAYDTSALSEAYLKGASGDEAPALDGSVGKRLAAEAAAVSHDSDADSNDEESGSAKPQPRLAWSELGLARRSASTIDLPQAPTPVITQETPADDRAARNLFFLQRVLAQRQFGWHWKRYRSVGPPPPHVRTVGARRTTLPAPLHVQQLTFKCEDYCFKPSSGEARIAVVRLPAVGEELDDMLTVHWVTEDGDAVAGMDYEASVGSVSFARYQETAYLTVPLTEHDNSEPDVFFYVRLTVVEGGSAAIIAQKRVRVKLVQQAESGGVLGFEVPEYEVVYQYLRPFVDVAVVRRKGFEGLVGVSYAMEDDTAVAGKDYVRTEGKIMLDPGQRTASLRIALLPGDLSRTALDARHSLRVLLSAPEGGAGLSTTRGSTTVTITRGDSLLHPHRSNSLSKGGTKPQFKLGEAWWSQFKGSFELHKPSDGLPVRWYHLLEQYVSYSWLVMLNLCVPPSEWAGGYPTFAVALLFIIGNVYLVEEASLLLGCIVGLKDIMTGLSILSMGTSLAATFICGIAARTQPDADAAIGNVMASTSVNVFIGLGAPWVVCSVYAHTQGKKYKVESGDLSFAVMLFAIFGSIGFIALAVCRHFGGELGGSRLRKFGVGGVLLFSWVIYLILSGLRVDGYITLQM